MSTRCVVFTDQERLEETCLPMYAEGSVFSCSGPSVIHDDLGLADVQDEVIPGAPLCQVLELFSIPGLIIVGYETRHGGIIHKL